MPFVPRRLAVLSAIVLAAAVQVVHAAEPEESPNILARISSLAQNAAKPFGVEFFVDYYGVFQGNPVGGQSQSFAYSQYLPFGLEWKEPLGWRGGGLRVSAVSGAGRDLSATIGNVFEVSQAWTDNTVFLYEAYLVQKAFDDRLEVLAGRISSSEFFAGLPALNLLVTGGLNSVPIALKLNSPFTGNASASWAAGARWLPAEETYITVGLFQARADLGESGPYHGLDLGFGKDDGAFAVAEVGWTPNSKQFTAVQEDRRFSRNRTELAGDQSGLPGIYKLGAYFSTTSEADYPGGWGGNPFGFYLLGQQTLWEESPGQTHGPHLCVFGGTTWSPPTGVSEMPWSGFAGSAWRGPLPVRPADRLYAVWQIGNFSESYAQSVGQSSNGAFESVLNAGYIIQVTKEFSVQPDIQYIIQPGGFGQANNALVLGLQITIEL
ncbi:MAG: carbohydrate porin [Chthoniobacterales bacterium]